MAGPLEVLKNPSMPEDEQIHGGVLGQDLGQASLQALSVPRDQARAHAQLFSWALSADLFVSHLVQAKPNLRVSS